MDVYLSWLANRLTALGGTLSRQAMHALPNQAPIVVNCSGLGARHLAADRSLTPVRGQVCLVEQVGLTEWWLDESDEENLCYIVPRLDTIVVGGTAEDGVWDRAPRPEVAKQLLSKAERLVPALAGARVVAHRVGLRPKRPTVRLEAEQLADGRLVVHCYGHGGAGMTLSWGCADEVRQLVDAHR
jgi:D-amino-acid oxidase